MSGVGAPVGTAIDTAIDTAVDGDPASLREAARWLRRGLATDVADAADRQLHGRRRAAEGWLGAGGDAYYDAAGVAVRASDDHAARVRRTADAVDDVAGWLASLERTMADVRDRAVAGGLVVVGTRVLAPVSSPLDDVGPWAPDGGSGGTALFARLAREVDEARTDHAEEVADRVARARRDAAERSDVDRALAGLEGSAAPAAGRPPAPGPAGPEGSQLAGGAAPAARADGAAGGGGAAGGATAGGGAGGGASGPGGLGGLGGVVGAPGGRRAGIGGLPAQGPPGRGTISGIGMPPGHGDVTPVLTLTSQEPPSGELRGVVSGLPVVTIGPRPCPDVGGRA